MTRYTRVHSWREMLRTMVLVLGVGLGITACDACDDKTTIKSAPPSTADFLGADDFDGAFTPGPTGPVKLGGRANYNGRIVFANLDRSAVEAVLPTDFRLAVSKTGVAAVHPVALILGHQTATGWLLPGGFSPPIGDDYTELILIVPFVQHAGSTLWHNYAVRIYLDDYWALVIGDWWFGLRKVDATFAETATTFEVFESVATKVFSLTVVDAGGWMSNSDAVSALPNYQAVQKIFEMPVLGTLSWTDEPTHVCSYFEWNYEGTSVRSAQTTHRFVAPFTGGMESWVGFDIPSGEGGGFEVRGLEWVMRLPPKGCDF